jgi:hypothetical protein
MEECAMHDVQQEACGGQGGTAFNWGLRARNPNAASGTIAAAESSDFLKAASGGRLLTLPSFLPGTRPTFLLDAFYCVA